MLFSTYNEVNKIKESITLKYFTEDKDDIEGYMKNLEGLKDMLDDATYQFMVNYSFHDNVLDKLSVEHHESTDSKISPVSVTAQLTDWEDRKYQLVWKNVSVYSVDFDITRNRVVETKEILYNRGLDQWSHDELTQTESGELHHEIILFSETRIIIRCKNFVIKELTQ